MTQLLNDKDNLLTETTNLAQQNAEKIYNIKHANNVNNVVNYNNFRSSLSPESYYNLFVIGGEKYESDYFQLRGDRVLLV